MPHFVVSVRKKGSAGRGGAGEGYLRRTALVLPGVAGSPGLLLMVIGSATVVARAVVTAVAVVPAGRAVNAAADEAADLLGGRDVFDGG